jgi:site-specific recombinase XerD
MWKTAVIRHVRPGVPKRILNRRHRRLRKLPMSHPEKRVSPFLEQVRQAIRVRHYSVRTEKSYIHWIVRFIHFHGRRHPGELGESEVGKYLSYLAVERNVAESTQNQALSALSFLYKAVLQRPLGAMPGLVRAKRPHRLPIVVRRGKGGKDRAVTFPEEVVVPLKRHLRSVKLFHDKDLSDGFGDVYLPNALARKY